MSEAADIEYGRSARILEIVATILLSLATVATAWSGYQASRWNAEQAKAGARANAARLESTRASGVANRNTQIDVAVFTQWVDAYARGDTRLADFYEKRFREEFRPAFEAWIASKPLTNPNAPLTPFATPQYVLAADTEAKRLEQLSANFADQAFADVQRATNYVFAVTLFAVALFFAGISTRLGNPAVRTAIIGLGCVIFLGAAIWVSTFPVSVSF